MEGTVEQPPIRSAAAPDLTGRRSFLGWLIGGIAAFVTSAVGISGVGAVVGSGLGERAATRIAIGPIDDYTLAQPKLAQFTLARVDGWVRTLEVRAVWVVRTGEREATVFNGRCTHLGCAYSWRTEGQFAQKFFCPCHDGTYDKNGTVLGGPPPRPLDTLEAIVEGGTLFIVYRDFRLGIPDKLPV